MPGLQAHTDADLATGKNLAYAGIAVVVVGFFIAGPILAIVPGALLFLISMYFVMPVGW